MIEVTKVCSRCKRYIYVVTNTMPILIVCDSCKNKNEKEG